MSFGVVALSTGKTEKYYANVYMRSSFGGGITGRVVRRLCGDTTGTIKSLDTSKDMITLDNGSSYLAPKA